VVALAYWANVPIVHLNGAAFVVSAGATVIGTEWILRLLGAGFSLTRNARDGPASLRPGSIEAPRFRFCVALRALGGRGGGDALSFPFPFVFELNSCVASSDSNSSSGGAVAIDCDRCLVEALDPARARDARDVNASGRSLPLWLAL
jgi:hypothetical protein